MVAKTLKDREAALRVKESQLIEALDRLRSLEKQTTAEARELRLISADLRQRLDAQEEEGEKLAATLADMQMGTGLDFETLMNKIAFEEIRLHLLHSSYEQTLEKLMANNPNLDLSCLNDEEEPTEDADATAKTIEEGKGIKKVADEVAGSEQVGEQIVGFELEAELEVAGGRKRRRIERLRCLASLKGVSLLSLHP